MTHDEAHELLISYEAHARRHRRISVRFPDDWELDVWYAPTAGSPIIRETNMGFGYLWHQLKTRTTKRGNTAHYVVRETQRGGLDDFPLRRECVEFLETQPPCGEVV